MNFCFVLIFTELQPHAARWTTFSSLFPPLEEKIFSSFPKKFFVRTDSHLEFLQNQQSDGSIKEK